MAENFFREQREKIGKTQFQIAVAAGCTSSAVAAWETFKSTPKLRNAAKLAEVYEVSEKRMTDEIVAQSKAEPAVK
jgi:transcriptional regulator with XRE-family HTH domain